jgi:hypothetical protein
MPALRNWRAWVLNGPAMAPPGKTPLGELADYRKIHGHCIVPISYSENIKLGRWVGTQRSNYRLQQEGKKSQMSLARIQALKRLNSEWKSPIGWGEGTPKKPKASTMTRCLFARRPWMYQSMCKEQHRLKRISALEIFAAIKPTSLSDPKNPTGMAKSTSRTSQVEPKIFRRLEA